MSLGVANESFNKKADPIESLKKSLEVLENQLKTLKKEREEQISALRASNDVT